MTEDFVWYSWNIGHCCLFLVDWLLFVWKEAGTTFNMETLSVINKQENKVPEVDRSSTGNAANYYMDEVGSSKYLIYIHYFINL